MLRLVLWRRDRWRGLGCWFGGSRSGGRWRSNARVSARVGGGNFADL